MHRYIVRRLLLMVPILIGVSLIVFIIMRIVPGDVATMLLMGPTGEVTRFLRDEPLGALGGLIIVTMVLMALFAPLLAPYDPYELRVEHLFAPPTRHSGWGPTTTAAMC